MIFAQVEFSFSSDVLYLFLKNGVKKGIDYWFKNGVNILNGKKKGCPMGTPFDVVAAGL